MLQEDQYNTNNDNSINIQNRRVAGYWKNQNLLINSNQEYPIENTYKNDISLKDQLRVKIALKM